MQGAADDVAYDLCGCEYDNCYGQTCDYYTYTCAVLESVYSCDCTGCSDCAPTPAPSVYPTESHTPTTGTAAPTAMPTVDLYATFESGWDDWESSDSTTSSNAFIRDSGGTPSSPTGPSEGADGSDYYVYAETSSNSNAVYTMSKSAGSLVDEVSFQYHMYGSTMGTLYLQGSTDGTFPVPNSTNPYVWTKSDDQGDSWQSAVVNVREGEYEYFRFYYTSGVDWYGDLALDNIELTLMSPTVAPTMTVMPSVSQAQSTSPPTVIVAPTIFCYTVRVGACTLV